MAKSDNISKALGSVSAVMTLLERYPVLLTADGTGYNSSFGLMLNILKILGLNEQDIIDWFSELLSGDGMDGLLEGLEAAVKGILIANIKNMFTCSVNPILPDELMTTYDVGGQTRNGEGVDMDLDNIDLYGVLGNCPSNSEGSTFYFDAYDSDYNPDTEGHPSLTPNNLWKSRDFNAFLWYVINKGTISDENKLYWDNRIDYYKPFKEDISLRERFFNTIGSTDQSSIMVENGVYKKQIVRCEYVERPNNTIMSNMLKVHANRNRYYRKREVRLRLINGDDKLFHLNKTVFEFNYDYIMSLKLFNSKTLVANIVNAILGIVSNISLNYSINRDVVAAQVGQIVKNIIEETDTEVTDCHFTFSNDEYEKMMADSIKKHNGTYTYDNSNIDVDYSDIINTINEISSAADLQKRTQAIKNAFTNISATLAKDGEVSESDSFSFGLGVIHNLLKETITQIVMQVLSPKVMILYKINSKIMGDLDPENDSWDYFMKNMENLVVNLVKEISDILNKQVYSWMMSQLAPLLEIYTSRILLEKIRFYRELIEQIIACGQGILNFFDGNSPLTEYAIDNVNYADIVPVQTAPKQEC